ncbi:MAG: hypothetical protein J2P26_03470 [Nocardiopsaceae bacterium]|nr:hypothetical protein [Nocardiopsaceae bacterium]
MHLADWHRSLPAAETSVPCGDGTHTVRWEAGRLTLPAHPDAEAELVLGALGGDKPACVSLTETWDRHAGDLAVLAAGPRSAADRVTVTWEQIAGQRTHLAGPGGGGRFGWYAYAPLSTPGTPTAPGAPATSSAPGPPAGVPRRGTVAARTMRMSGGGGRGLRVTAGLGGEEEITRRARERFEVLVLLALGPEFQFRLSGAVAAAWADEGRAGERAERRPELTAALTGRFAPVAAEWLGIDPDAVTIAPHEGPGWGTLSLTGDGDRLTGALPVSWLAEVWACGLAIADGHLVVAVTEPGYPRARVLALPEPGASPIPLEVSR